MKLLLTANKFWMKRFGVWQWSYIIFGILLFTVISILPPASVDFKNEPMLFINGTLVFFWIGYFSFPTDMQNQSGKLGADLSYYMDLPFTRKQYVQILYLERLSFVTIFFTCILVGRILITLFFPAYPINFSFLMILYIFSMVMLTTPVYIMFDKYYYNSLLRLFIHSILIMAILLAGIFINPYLTLLYLPVMLYEYTRSVYLFERLDIVERR